MERLAAARRLLQSEHIAPEHKSELEQVMTLLGGASDEVKLAWLLQDIDRFDMLSAWCPKSDLGNAYYFSYRALQLFESNRMILSSEGMKMEHINDVSPNV